MDSRIGIIARNIVPFGGWIPHKYEITDQDGTHVGNIDGQFSLKDRYEITIDDASTVPRSRSSPRRRIDAIRGTDRDPRAPESFVPGSRRDGYAPPDGPPTTRPRRNGVGLAAGTTRGHPTPTGDGTAEPAASDTPTGEDPLGVLEMETVYEVVTSPDGHRPTSQRVTASRSLTSSRRPVLDCSAAEPICWPTARMDRYSASRTSPSAVRGYRLLVPLTPLTAPTASSSST